MKKKAIDAYRILNDLVVDLIAGTRTLELYQSTTIKSVANQHVKLAARRMCISHLTITLSKWSEFYKKYKSIFPKDIIEKAKKLQKDIKIREIVNFRNTVSGHIWDNKLNRVLTPKEIDLRLQKVFITNQKDFLNWINDHKNKNQTDTVISIFEFLRKRIQEKYNLTEKEIFRA